MKRLFCIAILAIAPTFVAFTQDSSATDTSEVYEEEMSNLEYYSWETISSIIPLLVFAAFMAFFIIKAQRKNKPYVQRSTQHMDRMEEKFDRIINLLEELSRNR